ncbi:MAG: septum formation initiator family protein [Gordonia sp. (in: high G+C Gram-positive bacteria)]|uniref:FtsB family cell division protein n=1 Tax=Gordonia sp. (in: high G+C Gram-positive bacteria) TaxID=84139 RepID=UPI003C715DEE
MAETASARSHAGGRNRRPSDDAKRVPQHNESADLHAPLSRLAMFAHRRGVSVTAVGIALGLGIFLMLTLAVPARTYLAQRNEFNDLRASNAQLERETAEYEAKLAQQNDPAYIEAQARERLQMVPKGEKPIVIIDPSRKQQEAQQAAERERAATPWYQNLMDAVATPPKG